MITKNFKNIMKSMLVCASSSLSGDGAIRNYEGACFPVIDVKNSRWYLSTKSVTSGFPASSYHDINFKKNYPGISFGIGNTPATENDIDLESMFTDSTKLSAVITSKISKKNEYGNPVLEFNITLTNNCAELLTIKEVGWRVNVLATCMPDDGAPMYNNTTPLVLLDRTVLATPLTLYPGDAGVINYSLRVIDIQEGRYVNGVKIVSWTGGSDSDVAAMIDAAQSGVIDLQTDGGWKVGDMRRINLGSYSDSRGNTRAAQVIWIVISDFSEYNNCGNVLQFDFAVCPMDDDYMHTAKMQNGQGYGNTAMHTITCPSIVNAMPDWLKTRLKTFSVIADKCSGNNTVLDTVTDNKLAQRSITELFGQNPTAYHGSYTCNLNEGEQVALYSTYNPVLTKNHNSGASMAYVTAVFSRTLVDYNTSSTGYSWFTLYYVDAVAVVNVENGASQVRSTMLFGCL